MDLLGPYFLPFFRPISIIFVQLNSRWLFCNYSLTSFDHIGALISFDYLCDYCFIPSWPSLTLFDYFFSTILLNPLWPHLNSLNSFKPSLPICLSYIVSLPTVRVTYKFYHVSIERRIFGSPTIDCEAWQMPDQAIRRQPRASQSSILDNSLITLSIAKNRKRNQAVMRDGLSAVVRRRFS